MYVERVGGGASVYNNNNNNNNIRRFTRWARLNTIIKMLIIYLVPRNTSWQQRPDNGRRDHQTLPQQQTLHGRIVQTWVMEGWNGVSEKAEMWDDVLLYKVTWCLFYDVGYQS